MSDGPASWIGQRVADRYLIQHELGKGGMGRVFRAEQQPLGRPVAVKVLDPSARLRAAADPERRFGREAATLARLQHPNTVRIIDFGAWKDAAYLVMELVDGPTLRELFADGARLEPTRALRLMSQIAGSVGEAHRLGIVHRDLKPGNVLIAAPGTPTERAKVCDFGLVKLGAAGDDSIPSNVVLGTPRYMSPEQITGDSVDARADVYALGVLMFRALTGSVPFNQRPAGALLHAQVHEPAPSFAKIDPNLRVPFGTEAVVQRCLSKDRTQRYPDGAALQQAIDGLLLRQPPPRPSQASAAWRAVLIALILLIVTTMASVVILMWLG